MQPSLFPLPQEERTSDDYWTPKWVFDTLGLEFDLDVACPPEGPPHTPALAWYTQETDGLASPWWGRVWMNPPFSGSGPWVAKWLAHGNGIALTQVSKSSWFDNLWRNADAMLMLPPSLKFDQGPIYMPTVLAAMGADNVEALHRMGTRVR